uniref:Uncharacterized protein n=1 Tax=Rhizophora mucronata TaxID=61149 RepID=A0A2P2MZY4_RHIMU
MEKNENYWRLLLGPNMNALSISKFLEKFDQQQLNKDKDPSTKKDNPIA